MGKYDAVIIAAPVNLEGQPAESSLQVIDLNNGKTLSDMIPSKPYQTTVTTFVIGSINKSHFIKDTNMKNFPHSIFLTAGTEHRV